MVKTIGSYRIDEMTDQGLKRSKNEDFSLTYIPTEGSPEARLGILLAIADGIGSLGHGEVASRVCIETLRQNYYDSAIETPQIPERLKVAVLRAHEAVKQSALDLEVSRIGTTIAALVLHPETERVYLFNIGDTRIYRFNARYLEMLSADDISESAEISSNKPLSSFIGQNNPPSVKVQTLSLSPNDNFVLCTDGVWKFLSTDDLFQLLTENPLSEALAKTVKKIHSTGAPDNLTLIVAQSLNSQFGRRGSTWLFPIGLVAAGLLVGSVASVVLPRLIQSNVSVTQTAVDATDESLIPATVSTSGSIQVVFSTLTLAETSTLSETEAAANEEALMLAATQTADVSASQTSILVALSTGTVLAQQATESGEIFGTQTQSALEAVPSATKTPRPRPSSTPTDVPIRRASRTPTATSTPTKSDTATALPTALPTRTPAPTVTQAPEDTSTATRTATNTPSKTPRATNTPTITPSNTPIPSNTPKTPTVTNTPTASNTPTRTPAATNTPTITITPSKTPIPSNTPTATNTPKTPTAIATSSAVVPPRITQKPTLDATTPEATEATETQALYPDNAFIREGGFTTEELQRYLLDGGLVVLDTGLYRTATTDETKTITLPEGTVMIQRNTQMVISPNKDRFYESQVIVSPDTSLVSKIIYLPEEAVNNDVVTPVKPYAILGQGVRLNKGIEKIEILIYTSAEPYIPILDVVVNSFGEVWYAIDYGDYSGYVLKESVTVKNSDLLPEPTPPS